MNQDSIPLVSVIIPTFNHANFRKSDESVINQTYGNWEAIVVDNHSTDETYQVIKKFKDSRIQYLKISNGGIIAKSEILELMLQKENGLLF